MLMHVILCALARIYNLRYSTQASEHASCIMHGKSILAYNDIKIESSLHMHVYLFGLVNDSALESQFTNQMYNVKDQECIMIMWHVTVT